MNILEYQKGYPSEGTLQNPVGAGGFLGGKKVRQEESKGDGKKQSGKGWKENRRKSP
jgi:hypothetical protein